jgi:hypothetical protein
MMLVSLMDRAYGNQRGQSLIKLYSSCLSVKFSLQLKIGVHLNHLSGKISPGDELGGKRAAY